MSATSYLRKKIVDDLTGVAAYAPPELFLALLAADPGESGSTASEVTGGGYARVSLAGKMGAADAVTGISVNVDPINFAPASSDWGLVAFLGIMNAATGGVILVPGVPSTPKTITSGMPFQIPPGNLRLRLT